ncbi:MAG: type II secretion system minor pseudopilin GspK [Burkholderiales bacterium]|nr:type II secretion system minor pseudopilin GspK [Burkholderiales bacterium]
MTRRQAGAALLTAMLTVALVASMASAALWQQWRSVEVETAQRARSQSLWVLTGALDWARLILREDRRASAIEDHLGEPWAVPLEEARLSTFLAVDKNNTPDEADSAAQVFLSGNITDLQSRMNVFNLVDKQGQVSTVWLRAFGKLFEQLGLPPSELPVLAENLRFARDNTAATTWASKAPLMPQRVGQLRWLGLSSRSLALLADTITLLPESTAVNLNTASATVLYACIPTLDMAQAQRLVSSRQAAHFRNFEDVNKLVPGIASELKTEDHGFSSSFFEIQGRLRLQQTVVEERSLVQRKGMDMKTLWRDRGAQPPATSPLQ